LFKDYVAIAFLPFNFYIYVCEKIIITSVGWNPDYFL